MIREICYALHNNIEGIGSATLKRLLEKYESYEKVYESLKRPKTELKEIQNKLNQYKKAGIHFVGYGEESYPGLLKEIDSAPLGLFYKGSLPDREITSLAIVGSRNCSVYGRETARNMARILSENGVQIVSGLARGIDGHAHEGALLGRSPTFAVLGSGVDVCYPRSNGSLYRRILDEGGGIISEFEPGTAARPVNFPIRNRIISGLSQGILVIEARLKSGSLITTNFALEQNREVYAVPGRIEDEESRGCNDLIKQGAKLVEGAVDILNDEVFLRSRNGNIINKSKIVLETTEKIVYAKLRCKPKHIDEIAKAADLSYVDILRALISLEHKRLCVQIAPNYYMRNPS